MNSTPSTLRLFIIRRQAPAFWPGAPREDGAVRTWALWLLLMLLAAGTFRPLLGFSKPIYQSRGRSLTNARAGGRAKTAAARLVATPLDAVVAQGALFRAFHGRLRRLFAGGRLGEHVDDDEVGGGARGRVAGLAGVADRTHHLDDVAI